MSRSPSLLLLFLSIVVTATATGFPGCEPVSCCENGSVNITYPFHAIYGNVSNAPFCGYGHLGMFCFDGFPTVGISSINYTVLDINTSTITITVVESAVRNSSCPLPPTTNFRDPAIPCRVAPSKLTFFFNCSSSPSPNCSSIRCSGNSSFDLGNNITDFSVGGCEMSMFPVMNVSIDWNNDQLGKEFKGLVKKGFQLEWHPCLPKDCKNCENSGGRWGSNYTKDGCIFDCYCPFGLTKDDCGDRRLPGERLIYFASSVSYPSSTLLPTFILYHILIRT